MKTLLKSAVLMLLVHCASAQKRPNVLFIAIDDLRPELGCYGSDQAITPNLDALSQRGLLFNKAYCQQAICSPSRASLMTGARPETIKVIENYTYFRDINPDIVTLPQHFRENGYETVYCGKIFHGEYTDEEKSWSRQPAVKALGIKRPHLPGGYALPENQETFKKDKSAMVKKYGEAAKYGIGNGPAYEFADVPDVTYEDGYNTQLAIATMKDMAKNDDKPFFLGLGFHRPHLNWQAPKRYWDMYDEDKISLATQKEGPKGGAAMGLHASFELRTRYDIPKEGAIDDKMAVNLKHAYLACVSYVDAQIGMMLAALDEAGLRENTIVIIWSDHGWHLGDMGIWGKATNYEIATRVPLIISAPSMKESIRGQKTDALVELVDMYPSLCELAGISKPSHLEGHSFVPLMENPELKWKKAVFSQYPDPALREWAANPLSPGMRETYFGPLIEEVEGHIKEQQKGKWDRELFEKYLMGYSMRTKDYRLVVWKDTRKPKADPIDIELYDLSKDPAEMVNIASKKKATVHKLMNQFNAGWQGNLPDHHM